MAQGPRQGALLLTTVLLTLTSLPGASGQVPDGYAPVTSGTVCASSAAANSIPKLPRYNLFGNVVSSDLGSYPLFSCTGSGSSRVCTFNTNFMTTFQGGLSQSEMLAALRAAKGTIVDYGMSVAWYAVIPIAMAILVPLFTALCIIGRYCCCCCGPNRCTFLRCGTAAPTRRNCCCGFRTKPDGTVKYPTLERALVYLLMLLFISLATALIVAANYAGNYSFSKSSPNMLTRFDSLATLVQSLLPPVFDFAISVSDQALAPALSNISTTVSSAIDLSATLDALTCANATLYALPNVTAVLAIVAALNTSVTTVVGQVDVVNTELTALTAAKDSVVASVGLLSADISSLTTAFITMGGALDTAVAAVGEAVSLHGNVTRSAAVGSMPVGLAVSTLADLQKLPRVDAASLGTFPSVTSLKNASVPNVTSSPGTTFRLLSGAANGQSAEISQLSGRLQALLAQLSSSPNFTSTAATLSTLSAAVTSARGTNGLLRRLSSAIGGLEYASSLLPSNATINGHLDSLNTSVGSVSLTAIRAAVVSIKSVLDSLPPWEALLRELRLISALPSVLPCVRTLKDQLVSLNMTLLALPSSLSLLINSLYDDLNGTISVAVDAAATANSAIASANATIVGVNTSAYLSQIDTMSSLITSNFRDFNLTGFKSRVNELASRTRGLDFASTNATVSGLVSALTSVDTAVLDNATALLLMWENARTSLVTQLQRAAAPSGSGLNPGGDLTLLARGYCSGNLQYYCTVSADCTSVGASGPCIGKGVYRCSAGAQSTNCTSDAACPSPGYYCLADTGRVSSLQSGLVAASDGSVPPDASAATAQLAALLLAASTSDPSSSLGRVTSARAALQAVDTSAYSSQLASVRSSLEGSFNTTSISSTLAGITASLNAIPFASVRDKVSTVQGTLDGLASSARSAVSSGASALGALSGLLSTEFPRYQAILARGALSAQLSQHGPSVMLTSIVGGVVDAAVAYLTAQQSLVSVPLSPLQPLLSSATQLLDRAAGAPDTHPEATRHGAAYYFAQLALPDSLLPPSDPSAAFLYADAAGVPYAGGKVCLTKACLTASLATINSGGLGSWHSVAPAMLPALPISAPVTREHVLLALWLPPAIAVLLCLWALLPCCCRTPAWRKVPASCAAGVMVCQMPCIFILTALLWPLIMVLGDVCASGVNVGQNYILSQGDALCSSISGVGSARNCSLDVPLPLLGSLRASLDIPSLYSGVAGACGASDPLRSLASQAARLLAPLPLASARSALGASDLLRPPLTDIVLRAANTSGALLGALLEAEGGALACAPLNAALGSLREAICCDALPPLVWYVASWYLMAWAMLLCGLPAACLGRKRFPPQPWGRAYEEAMAEALPLEERLGEAGSAGGALHAGGGGGEEEGAGAPRRAAPKGRPPVYHAGHEVDGGHFHAEPEGGAPTSASAAGATAVMVDLAEEEGRQAPRPARRRGAGAQGYGTRAPEFA